MYERVVVERVWKRRSLLSTSFFFIKVFINADFPTFVYPTKATTGRIVPLLSLFSIRIFLNLASSSISLLICASLSLNLLLSSSSCDYPYPPKVLAAFLCFALITSIGVSVLLKRLTEKAPIVVKYVLPSLISRVRM